MRVHRKQWNNNVPSVVAKWCSVWRKNRSIFVVLTKPLLENPINKWVVEKEYGIISRWKRAFHRTPYCIVYLIMKGVDIWRRITSRSVYKSLEEVSKTAAWISVVGRKIKLFKAKSKIHLVFGWKILMDLSVAVFQTLQKGFFMLKVAYLCLL